MKTYKVQYRIYADVEVEAESFEEAIEKADEKWYDARFEKDFDIVEGESFYAETDDGLTQKWFY